MMAHRERYWMTQGVASKAGVDLAGEVARGELSEGALNRLVDRCAKCTQTEACRLMLTQGCADSLPGYCLNRETIEALAARR